MNDPRPIGPLEWMGPIDDTPLPLKLRLEDYLMLDDAGAFQDYTRTELIDGEIVYMNAQHRPHARVKSDLAYSLRREIETAGIALTVFVEVSVAAPPHDVPEPDILLTSEPDGEGLVPLGSVALIAEVADASLRFDLGKKRSRYATIGIPEYWVADVKARLIHQFWSPRDGAFAERREVRFGETIEAATIPGLRVATTGLG